MNNHKSFSFNIQISDYYNAWFTGILALVIMVRIFELFGVVIHRGLKEQDICIPTYTSTEFNNRDSNNNNSNSNNNNNNNNGNNNNNEKH